MTNWRDAVTAGLVTATLCMVLPSPSAGQGVFVEGREVGQGVLRSRGAECFLIAPYHVVKSSVGPLRFIGERAVRGTAELVRQLPSDLAVLRVTEPFTMKCGELSDDTELAREIRSQASGMLNIVERDGSVTLVPVQFKAVDEVAVYVEPSRAGDQIQTTMSGASLMVNGRLAGLLMSTDGRVGTVLRVDSVLRLSSSFFGERIDSAGKPTRAAGRFTLRVGPQASYGTTQLFNRLKLEGLPVSTTADSRILLIGPLDNSEDARKLSERIRAMGFTTVVEP